MPLGYFTDSTPLTPLRDPFNVLVDGINAVETAVEDLEESRAIQTFRWADATARAAQTGMLAGDIGYQVDTGARYTYGGGAWVINTNGRILLNSTSFTSVSSESVNSVFSPIFNTYEVVIEVPTVSTASVLTFRLRASGTDSTTGYGYQVLQASGTTTTSLQSGATSSWGITGSATRHSATLTIYSPGVATTTQSISNWISSTSTTSQASGQNGGYHSAATAYDGFTIATSTGTMTGSIKVLGVA